MEDISEVDIDVGKFKYIQIKLKDSKSGKERLIIRGYKWANFHADILSNFQSTQPKDIVSECPGGGRILHQLQDKKITVYGYSMGFGKADHKITCDLLKKRYPDYTIDWSDEGY